MTTQWVPAPGRPALVFGLSAAGLLAIALAPLDYGYYIFLRIAVTAAAIYVAVLASRASQVGWVVACAGIAIVFNPLIPVWLSREVWVPIDVAGAIVMAVAAIQVKGSRREG